MLLRQPLRRWLSSWLVLAVLFTQVATAAYACPMTASVVGENAGSASAPAMPCAEMMANGVALDPEQPGLCMQHCQGGSQTFDNASPATVPTPVWLPTPAVRLPDAAKLSLPAWVAQQRSRERDPPLAHSIDHCCYRI